MTNAKNQKPTNPVNDWDNFDPDLYYLASVDDKGHYKPSQVSTPPDAHAVAMALVASDDHPYRTLQDVYRDALIHLLEYRLRVKPDPSLHWQLMKFRDQEARRQRMEEFRVDQLLVQDVRSAVKQAKDLGDPSKLDKEIKAAEKIKHSLPPVLQSQIRDIILDAQAELEKMKQMYDRIMASSNGSHN